MPTTLETYMPEGFKGACLNKLERFQGQLPANCGGAIEEDVPQIVGFLGLSGQHTPALHHSQSAQVASRPP